MFSQINTAVPSGDTLGAAMGKINANTLDTINAICMGLVAGWNFEVYVGARTIESPEADLWLEQASYSGGAYQTVLRAAYGYSGSLLTTITYQKTTNGGGSYTTIGTLSLYYDGNGFMTGYLWS